MNMPRPDNATLEKAIEDVLEKHLPSFEGAIIPSMISAINSEFDKVQKKVAAISGTLLEFKSKKDNSVIAAVQVDRTKGVMKLLDDLQGNQIIVIQVQQDIETEIDKAVEEVTKATEAAKDDSQTALPVDNEKPKTKGSPPKRKKKTKASDEVVKKTEELPDSSEVDITVALVEDCNLDNDEWTKDTEFVIAEVIEGETISVSRDNGERTYTLSFEIFDALFKLVE